MLKMLHKKGMADNAGFTLVEVLIASAVGVLAALAVMSTFIWAMQQSALISKIGWSQAEAMKSSAKLIGYLRNAEEVVSIDESEGTWIELRFPGDTNSCILIYSNAIPLMRDGQMFLQREDGSETIVARGLTEVMDTGGFTTPIFQRVQSNLVRVAYRVAEPVAAGYRDVNDDPYAAVVRFAVCLRNLDAE